MHLRHTPAGTRLTWGQDRPWRARERLASWLVSAALRAALRISPPAPALEAQVRRGLRDAAAGINPGPALGAIAARTRTVRGPG